MKKFVLAITVTGALLAACGYEETNEQGLEEGEVEAPETEAEEQEAVEQTDSVDNEDYADLPEYATITEQVGSNYTFETVTDNEGNRILFLKDENGEKQYKTVFVKNTNNLEIIKINGQVGRIFEGKI